MMADTVMIDVPASTWEKFVQATTRQQQPAHDVLLWLIQNYVQHNKQAEAEFYSELTRCYLQGTLRRTGSINAIRLDPEIADAIQVTCETSDAVELIEQGRNRQ